MGVTIQLPDWHLNYHAAAIAAYATILVEAAHLIFGGFRNASPLTISILTNGSAVGLAGLGGSSPTAFAAFRICLTSLFLILSIVATNAGVPYDGTYAILCSVAHFTYQCLLRSNGGHSDNSQQQRADTKQLAGLTGDNEPHPRNEAVRFQRRIVVHFGDNLHFEGSILLLTTLGTAMIYRVFDFDLGFGLVFALLSALMCIALLSLIDFARTRGRGVQTKKAIQQFVGLSVIIGTFCYVFFTTSELDILQEIRWWKVTFGVSWFFFLARITYTPCLFFVHSILFPCARCRQRTAGLNGGIDPIVNPCPWDDCANLPLNSSEDENDKCTGFQITRRKGTDLVDRYWLNEQQWFQTSPRSFVIAFVTCLSLLLLSGFFNSYDSISLIGTAMCKNAAFYVTVAFTFAATGHTSVQNSPELICVPLKFNFLDCKAVMKALLTTAVVHTVLVSITSLEALASSIVPLVCLSLAPFLLSGISKGLETRSPQQNKRASGEKHTTNVASEEADDTSIDQTLVYSSARIRCLDLRVLFMGISVTSLDVFCNNRHGAWPLSAIVLTFTISIVLLLENCLPPSRDVEPGILSIATIALVGIFSHFDFLSLFGIFDNEFDDYSGHTNSITISAWYSLLSYMIIVNRRLVNQRADQTFQAEGKPQIQDHLIMNLDWDRSNFKLRWQLRNSRVAMALLLGFVSSLFGESWPLEANTTFTGLVAFVCVAGFQLQPTRKSTNESPSVRHIIALAFCVAATTLAIGLQRYKLLDYGSDWKTGSWAALVSYQLFLVAYGYLDRIRSVNKKSDSVEDPQSEKTQDGGVANLPEEETFGKSGVDKVDIGNL